jgi:hypothetical protein
MQPESDWTLQSDELELVNTLCSTTFEPAGDNTPLMFHHVLVSYPSVLACGDVQPLIG